jgi:hypothetical protein
MDRALLCSGGKSVLLLLLLASAKHAAPCPRVACAVQFGSGLSLAAHLFQVGKARLIFSAEAATTWRPAAVQQSLQSALVKQSSASVTVYYLFPYPSHTADRIPPACLVNDQRG